MSTYSAFHGDPEFRAQLIELARQHRIADRYRRGAYARICEDGLFRGCSIGCCISDINRMRGLSGDYTDRGFLAEQLGVPVEICMLQEWIFEGLLQEAAYGWTERLLGAIQPGADLSPVLPRLAVAAWHKRLSSIDREKYPGAYGLVRKAVGMFDIWAVTGGVHREMLKNAITFAKSELNEAIRNQEPTRDVLEMAAIALSSFAQHAGLSINNPYGVWADEWMLDGVGDDDISIEWLADHLLTFIEQCAAAQQADDGRLDGLTNRTANTLYRAGYRSRKQVIEAGIVAWLKLPRFGCVSLAETIDWLGSTYRPPATGGYYGTL